MVLKYVTAEVKNVEIEVADSLLSNTQQQLLMI